MKSVGQNHADIVFLYKLHLLVVADISSGLELLFRNKVGNQTWTSEHGHNQWHMLIYLNFPSKVLFWYSSTRFQFLCNFLKNAFLNLDRESYFEHWVPLCIYGTFYSSFSWYAKLPYWTIIPYFDSLQFINILNPILGKSPSFKSIWFF